MSPNTKKGTTMTTRLAFGLVVMMSVLVLPAHAGGKTELQQYFSNAADKVKATEDPVAKRAILNESLQSMAKALDIVETSTPISDAEAAGLQRFRNSLQEKQDELAGRNGFAAVPDAQLNAFSQYVVQDMEQADQMVTISIVTLLLIVIILILIL